MTTNIPDLIAKMQEQLAALGDGRDCKSENERAEYITTYNAIQRTLSGLINPNLAKPTALLIDLDARRVAVVEKEQEILKQISEAPDLGTFTNAVTRDREHDRQQHLRQQLQRLREGTLLAAPGVTYELLDDLDRRIAELTARRDRAQATLDAHVKQAEALLSVTT